MTEHKMNNQYFSVAPSTDGLGVERFRTEKDGFTVDIFDRKENVNLEERFLLRISEGEKHIGSGTIKSREDVSDLVDKILSSITSKATTSPQ